MLIKVMILKRKKLIKYIKYLNKDIINILFIFLFKNINIEKLKKIKII